MAALPNFPAKATCQPMLWILFSLVLIVIIALLWVRHKQEKEWLLEMTYLRRHESGGPAPLPEHIKEAKDIRGANPNLQNSRNNQQAAAESRAVYERTVEKLREIAPKRSQKKLDALLGKLDPNEQADIAELPIFSGQYAGQDNRFAEVAHQPEASSSIAANRLRQAVSSNNPVRTSDNHISIASYLAGSDGLHPSARPSERHTITAEDIYGLSTQHNRSIPDITDFETDPEMLRRPNRPNADLPVITLEEATRSVQQAAEPDQSAEKQVKTITLDDPAVERTRSRTLAEVNKLSVENFRPERQDMRLHSRHQPLIDQSEIEANLYRQQIGHYSQHRSDRLRQDTSPEVIPSDEIFANLARNNSPAAHRLRRVNNANESVIPEGVRIEQSHGAEIPRPRPMVAAGLNKPARPPLYQARASEPAAPSKKIMPQAVAVPPAPDATVVEPPAIPETPKPVIDIPPPPTFSEPPQTRLPDPSAHITDRPSWSIRDRLISESAPDAPQSDSTVEEWLAGHQPEESPSEYAADADDDIHMQSYDEHADYQLPSIALLQPPQFDSNATQSEEALLENSITIEEKLAEFKVKVKVMDAYAGPVITRYEIEPDVGVRGNAVLNLEKDLARSLGVSSIRVVETIPGKTCMGLELPNPRRQTIRLSEIFAAPVFTQSRSKLTLALGHDITGQPVVTDLAKAPHLLVAGTTGSGKSVGVNAMILSMLFKASPEDVRLIMIDPKMLELSIYEGIPHLLAPVVTDMRLAANALNWCVNEMEKRYRLMSHLGVRNLAGYNDKVREAAAAGRKISNPFSLNPDDPEPLEKLPFIVVVVDEFADLMMTAGKKIEELIARIAQKARAAGIHLILATQRPSVDVITGLIKANIPTRIAFQVSSKIDSRTILDQMGAESLLGQGDMLFLPPGTGYPQRVHGAFVQDDEVHAVVDYLKQTGEPNYIEDILTAGVGGDDMFSNAPGGMREGERDELYDEAVSAIIKSQKPTISSLQRFLRIGYNRAATLIDQMEADGIISAPDNANKRTILARNGDHLDG